jgi:hypothetical protein
MSPWQVLWLALAVTLFAYAAELLRRRRHLRALRRLAGERGMTFAQDDTIRLTPRVARHFPIPGAANLHIVNILYGSDADRYHYVFTAEYTLGVVNAKRRHARVASLTEPRDRARGGTAGAGPDAAESAAVVLAPTELPLMEQYRKMAQAGAEPGGDGASTTALRS